MNAPDVVHEEIDARLPEQLWGGILTVISLVHATHAGADCPIAPGFDSSTRAVFPTSIRSIPFAKLLAEFRLG